METNFNNRDLHKAFKNKYIYSELDSFGRLTSVITSNDYDSAGYVSSISSLVYSIITLEKDEYEKIVNGKRHGYQVILNHLARLFKARTYHRLFASKNNYLLYGYNNCCFLWNNKRFKKHTDQQPIYCDYLKIRTTGLEHYRFNPYMHIWIRALQTVYYQWMQIRDDEWRQHIDELIKHFSHDDDFPLLSSMIDLPLRPNEFDIARALIYYIRKDADHPLVLKEKRNFEETPARNAASSKAYIDSLFSQYSKLLVIRVDLGYQTAAFKHLDGTEAYAMIRRDQDRFFANMRHNSLFKHKVGFISKLEHGFDKGFHYHLILFFDGSKTQRDRYLAKQICKYWNANITTGQGNAFNCHAKQDEYKYKGIGKIRHQDQVLRSNLIDYVVRYLVKPELFASLVVPGDASGAHIFERGQIKQVVGSKRGRPRTTGLKAEVI